MTSAWPNTRIRPYLFHRFVMESASMKHVGHRIALFFKIGRQWLTASPRYRGALLCSLSAIGAIIVIGYNGHKSSLAQPAPVARTSDFAATQNPGTSNEFGASNAKGSLSSRSGDAEVVKPSIASNDSRSGKAGPSPSAI